MKKTYVLAVRGNQHEWRFHVELDPKHMNDWLEDGVRIEGEVVNSVPDWLPAPLTRPWCFFQDVFNFRNPFA